MSHRLLPSLALVAVLAAACTGGPALTDPKEIITQGFTATQDVKSFHMAATIDGTVTIPETGGTISLNGSTFQADIDIDGKKGNASFALPSMFGLAGQLILLDKDIYIKLSVTGEQWYHQTATESSLGDATDPEQAITGVKEFLQQEGVQSTKLDDVDCGDRSCYHVQVSFPSALLNDAVGDAGTSVPAGSLPETLTVDMLFDRENLRFTEASTSVESPQFGTISVRITLSAFDEEVTISPPPADQVTEGVPGGGLGF